MGPLTIWHLWCSFGYCRRMDYIAVVHRSEHASVRFNGNAQNPSGTVVWKKILTIFSPLAPLLEKMCTWTP